MRAVRLAILTILICVVQANAYAWQETSKADGAGQGGAVKKLVWKLKPGQRFNVTLSKKANIETKVDTRIRKVDAETILELEWEVISSDDAGADIRQTLKRIRLTSGAPGDVSARRLNYDSAVKVYRSGLSGKVTKQYQPAVGLVSTFILSPAGEVSDFATEAGQEKKTAKLPDQSAVKEMLSGQSAQTTVSQLTDLSWQSESDISKVKRDVKSELGEFVRVDSYRIQDDAGQTAVQVKTSAEGLSRGNSAAKVDRYEGQGSIEFSTAGGFIKSSTSTLTVASRTPYRDMKVESLTEVQTSMTLNEIK
jgi:hypothetical protein